MSAPGEITILLQKTEQGDSDAANHLFQLVENDLKMIARKRKRAIAGQLEMPTTEIVDDAFLRLLGQNNSVQDRHCFYRFVSTKIHDLLIESVRAANALKRGGGHQRVDQEGAIEEIGDSGLDNYTLLLDLKTALAKFEQFAPNDAMLFRLRYFLGCTFEESAELAGVSVTEAKRGFQRARLWLQSELKEYRHES